MFQLRDNCHVGSKVKLPSKADTILFSSKLHSKASSPNISFYITCINSFMSLYRTTSSRLDPVWLPSAVRWGLFHFRFAPLIRGLLSYGVEWAVTPPREQFIIIIIIYFNLCIKKLDKFFLGLKRVSSDFRSSRFQNLPGEHTLGHPVSSLSVLRIAY